MTKTRQLINDLCHRAAKISKDLGIKVTTLGNHAAKNAYVFDDLERGVVSGNVQDELEKFLDKIEAEQNKPAKKGGRS